MRHISILIINEAVLASIVDPRVIFTGVNDFLIAAGKPPAFNVQLIGLEKEVRLHGGLFSVHTDALLQDVKKTDLIIIPAISGDIKTTLKRNEDFMPWIIDQHNKGAEAASLCIGAFLLASTGLLDGKECSSHWRTANDYRSSSQRLTLVHARIVTDQNGVNSSGGETSDCNMLLYLK
jgi:transcriptional regulator GlxA family with amidase domain